MKKIIFSIILSVLLLIPCTAQDKDVYQLAVVSIRNFDSNKIKSIQKRANPEGVVGKWLKAVVLSNDHKYEQSQQALVEIQENYPGFYPAQVTLMNTYFLQEKYLDTYLLAKKLIEKRGEIPKYHYVTSLLFAGAAKGMMVKNNPAKSALAYFEIKSYFNKAQKLMPNSPEVQYGIGTFKLLTPAIVGGSPNKAIVYLKKAQAQTPLNPNIYVRIAQAYKQKDDMVNYKKYLLKAQQLDPKNTLLLKE